MRLITYWLAMLVFSFAAVGGLLTFAHAYPWYGCAAILTVFAGVVAMVTDTRMAD